MNIGVPELLIVLAILLLLFGVGRVANVAGELGKAVHSFREGMEGSGEKKKDAPVEAPDGRVETK